MVKMVQCPEEAIPPFVVKFLRKLYKAKFKLIITMKRSSKRWKKKGQMRWKWQRKRLKKEKRKRKLKRNSRSSSI